MLSEIIANPKDNFTLEFATAGRKTIHLRVKRRNDMVSKLPFDSLARPELREGPRFESLSLHQRVGLIRWIRSG